MKSKKDEKQRPLQRLAFAVGARSEARPAERALADGQAIAAGIYNVAFA